ncbi:MAG: hypothetical protein Q9201_002722 [Fulgogasparrea decipioides]
MDFIEGVGQRYLERKANAVPQQVEDLVKKRVNGDPAAPNKTGPVVQNSVKDKEIADLKKQLAEAKLSQNGRQAETTERKQSVRSVAASTVSTKSRKHAGSVSGESARLRPASGDYDLKGDREHKHAVTGNDFRRGRSDSIKTAVAALPPSSGHHKGQKEANKPRSTDGSHFNLPSQRDDKILHSADQKIVFKTPVYQQKTMPPSSEEQASRRSRSASDIFVVEVIEDEPRKPRRTHRGNANVAEVIERDRYRTRYVIR